jgi:hypothetical protein
MSLLRVDEILLPVESQGEAETILPTPIDSRSSPNQGKGTLAPETARRGARPGCAPSAFVSMVTGPLSGRTRRFFLDLGAGGLPRGVRYPAPTPRRPARMGRIGRDLPSLPVWMCEDEAMRAGKRDPASGCGQYHFLGSETRGPAVGSMTLISNSLGQNLPVTKSRFPSRS